MSVAKLGLLSITCVHMGPNCPLYRAARCPLFRGCLSIEVNGRTVGTFRIVHYIMGVYFSGVSVKPGSTVLTMGTLEVWTYNIHLHHYIYVTHGQVI